MPFYLLIYRSTFFEGESLTPAWVSTRIPQEYKLVLLEDWLNQDWIQNGLHRNLWEPRDPGFPDPRTKGKKKSVILTKRHCLLWQDPAFHQYKKTGMIFAMSRAAMLLSWRTGNWEANLFKMEKTRLYSLCILPSPFHRLKHREVQ